MRAIILAGLVAVSVGLAFTPTVNAAPANGFTIGEDAQGAGAQKVQHWRWGSRRYWRRCHRRHWSRSYRC